MERIGSILCCFTMAAAALCSQISAQDLVRRTGPRISLDNPAQAKDGSLHHQFALSADSNLVKSSNVNSAPPNPTVAAVGNGLSAPVYVNLYWDATWDFDNTNPPLPQGVLDTFTSAIVNSSYFSGLAEYGVGSPTFGGGFLPDPACPQKAPAQVGFYDPTNPSIIGFLNCELQHGVPQGPQVVYNIILPQGTLESDFFGNFTFCKGGHPVAWHFHETPYTPEGASAVGTALLALATGGAPAALQAFLVALATLQQGPFYTIESADSHCGNFVDNLLHEMVEAASDPFPSPGAIINENEIVDVADNLAVQALKINPNSTVCQPTHPFVPQFSLPDFLVSSSVSFTTTPFSFTTSSTINVPQYWSNLQQQCVTGFPNNITGFPNTATSTTPTGVCPLTITATGNGVGLTMSITGQGFGTLPGSGSSPSSSPYIGIQDETQKWQAGNSLNNDAFGINIASWSDTAIIVNGFNFGIGNLVMKPKDTLSLWVCNPLSGLCGIGVVSNLAVSGTPQTRITVFDDPNVNLFFNLSIDGNQRANAVPNGGGTGWITLTSGTHTISEAPTTTPAFYNARFLGPCVGTGGPSATQTLNVGDNQACSIINTPGTGCPSGQHCCSNPSTTRGCPTACIPNSVACQPLCPSGENLCCGNPLPTGQCDSACVKHPPESCH